MFIRYLSGSLKFLDFARNDMGLTSLGMTQDWFRSG